MTDRIPTRRHTLLPVCAYLPDWARRFVRPLTRLHDTAPPNSITESGRTTSSSYKGDTPMKAPTRLTLHPGDRAATVTALQQALYDALMHDDPARRAEVLALDHRLSARADLHAVATPPDDDV